MYWNAAPNRRLMLKTSAYLGREGRELVCLAHLGRTPVALVLQP